MKDSDKKNSWKARIHEIIYEADTKEGKLFDVILLLAILASVILVILESVQSIDVKYHTLLNVSEWIITILFTIEYVLRIISIKKPLSYIFSFYGIIDLLSTIPKYLSFIIIGSQNLIALRALRLFRVFRILKLTRYIGASNRLIIALKSSRTKIAVFLFFIIILCTILGTIMYIVEGEENGFTNIPKSIYWAIVTLTTVGFGDITPQTPLGQLIASVIMILGYAIIAIPTGIVSSEMTKSNQMLEENTQVCPNCGKDNHKENAKFCYDCGSLLNSR
ncbi:MAG: ion transporter [Flavobacteriia bacterium]|nr:ion transporter [Flavobacteriia bacterium]PIV96226.1 MAG: ion transporter [Flavobacteriaceae bacterium CG17_big_fil_post_rev_8_21_14_2_50_31_13]PIX12868.1 MAG: ion transporter [Flavobacteriaceae bacterium CG_4_8_14_3_um_filter_31_8]PIY13764.1 MAG: ion transporter [Flavobacteriaceae bacterium CG_4_10_14_3_um_filter_31_253]PIZ12366.1 MAG: ion transporter [Flavobacteriaceae bacterium CG_4_10_14_0_8_um_filter_31_99]PJC11317.1 MAG: ion transporter [Flavobacteriaceae bacterium CG_4_9_14_0_8_um_fi